MSTVRLPGTDLDVSTICLGTGELGSSLDRHESFRMLDLFLELGGTFVDTAHNYGDWVPGLERSASEKAIGAWIAERGSRDRVVLATKGAHPLLDGRNVPRMSRAEIVADIDDSLRNLRTDRIDLYWIHKDDPATPVGEVLQVLNEQRAAGKIRWFGASNLKVPRLEEAAAHAAANDMQGFVADQSLWNAAVLAKPPYGDPSHGWMDDGGRYAFHRRTGMAFVAYQSQAYGLFSRIEAGTLDRMNPGFRGFYKEAESAERYRRMRQVMANTGLTLTQVTLGYLTGQPFPTIPIVGCRRPEQLADSMTALSVRLSSEQIRFIEEGQE